MFWHLKNRIKEETGNDVDLIPSLVSSNQPKINRDKHCQETAKGLGNFTIDGNDGDVTLPSVDLKLADGKVITPREFKKLESKEDEWRKKLQKKEEELTSKLKKVEELWKKQLEEKDTELKEILDKKENEKKILEEEKNELRLKIMQLEENAKRAADYQKKVCQYQEDIDQLEGFQTQEMAKVKHLLLVKEQEVAEKNQLLKESNAQIKSLKSELSRLRHFEQQYENAQDNLEALRHTFDLERSQLSSSLAEKEEDIRHLKDKVVLLEERANVGPIKELTVDERVQKLLGERALFERRLEEAHLHLSQIKSSWSNKIESLETQLGRLCRQASEESAEKRRAELERDFFKEKINELEEELEKIKKKSEISDSKVEKLKLEKNSLEEEISNLKSKTEEEICLFQKEIKSVRDVSIDVENKLTEKVNELTEKGELIRNLEEKLSVECESKQLIELKLQNLNESFDTEKKMHRETSTSLEKEKRLKDEMMMRNAQISQEVELARQEIRKQEAEAHELHSKINDLEDRLNSKEKDLESAISEKTELEVKIKKFEKFQKEQEFATTLENDLKTKIMKLENELLEKNKNIKTLQQRLADMKKTLQRELKVPANAIDPGGTDSDGLISYTSSPSSNSAAAVLNSNSSQMTSSPRISGEESYNDSNDDINFKYLKHVLMKFLTSRECEAQHLTRAVATLLRFSAEEERLLKETLEWKMSWFGTKPSLGNGQSAKTIRPS